MSDRVAWIGGFGQNQFGRTPGLGDIIGPQVSGRDHFPTVVWDASDGSIDIGDGTEFPIALSLADALWFYSVTKKVRFSGTIPRADSGTADFEVEGYSGGGTGYNWETRRPGFYRPDGNSQIVNPAAHTRESELVLGRQWGMSSDLIPALDSSPNSNSLCDMSFGGGGRTIFNQPPWFVYKDGLFYPNIIVDYGSGPHSDDQETSGDPDFIPTGWWIWPEDNTGDQSASSNYGPHPNDDDPGGTRIGTVAINIRGTDYTFGFYGNDTGLLNLDWEFDIELLEFWTYATKPSDDFPDGQDVYDTSTGEQINDPLS